MATESPSLNFEYWFRLARENWSSPLGFLFASIADVAIALLALRWLPFLVCLALFCLLEVLTALLWWKSRRIPRCPKGKIGFVVAFDCDDPHTAAQFESDFVDHLRGLLLDGKNAEAFWFKDLSDRKDLRARTLEEADALRARVRAIFVLYGKVRSRGKGKNLKHYVDVKGLVWHGQIGEHNKKLLEKEFAELMPRRIEVKDDGSLPAFELGSTLAEIASRYLIAVALSCAGSLDAAQTLFEGLKDELAGATALVPSLAMIKSRIPTRLMEIAVGRANACYRVWRETHNVESLQQISEHLNSVQESERIHLPWKALRAIVQVALENDLVGAKKTITTCGKDLPATRMNLAFVAACEGDLRAAAKHYRIAKNAGADLNLVEEVMDFLDWYRQGREQLRPELTFCLGFIACEISNDVVLAQAYFDEFSGVAAGRFAAERQLIPKWMAKHSAAL